VFCCFAEFLATKYLKKNQDTIPLPGTGTYESRVPFLSTATYSGTGCAFTVYWASSVVISYPLPSRNWIRDEHPGTYFRELKNILLLDLCLSKGSFTSLSWRQVGAVRPRSPPARHGGLQAARSVLRGQRHRRVRTRRRGNLQGQPHSFCADVAHLVFERCRSKQ
jgi:hypothetical protein